MSEEYIKSEKEWKYADKTEKMNGFQISFQTELLGYASEFKSCILGNAETIKQFWSSA